MKYVLKDFSWGIFPNGGDPMIVLHHIKIERVRYWHVMFPSGKTKYTKYWKPDMLDASYIKDYQMEKYQPVSSDMRTVIRTVFKTNWSDVEEAGW